MFEFDILESVICATLFLLSAYTMQHRDVFVVTRIVT